MTFRDFMLRAVAAFAAFNLIIVFTPISPYGLMFAVVASALLLLIDFRNGLLLVVSSFMLVLVLEAFVRLTGDSVITPYYRAHEMLAEETRYRGNQRIEMLQGHGDLLAIDPQLDRTLAQTRTVTFQTDSRGFRNAHELGDEKLVIVGDSFVVGIGNTQADTITAQLSNKHGIPAYNMGFPAGPFQYANIIAEARTELGEDACIVLVMFEGNDFQIIDPAELAARNAVPRGVQDLVKVYFGAVKAPFEASRVLYGMFSQGTHRLRSLFTEASGRPAAPAEDVTFLRNVGGEPMIFLKDYADVVMRDHYSDYGYIHDQFSWAMPDLIVFAPDKYRIYSQFLDDGPVYELPHAQSAHLSKVAQELNIPLLDLTDAIRAQSRVLLERGNVTYWRDDTHWNPYGIEVAAREISRVLPGHRKAACRGVSSGSRADNSQAAEY